MKVFFGFSPGKKCLKKITTVICLGFLISSAENAFAQPNTQCPKIVVTATRTEKDLQKVPASVAVVEEEEIRRKGYTSVADILQDVPGIEIYDQSLAGSKRINIRGESGSRILILIDGQKISEQKSMDGAPLLIDPAIIERIEVIKGPASVLYGAEAIGGVVNIITKKGGDRIIQGSADIIYDSSNDGFTESISLFGGINNFHYRVTGSKSDLGDRETPDKTLDGSDSERKSGSFFLGYDKDKFSAGISFEAFDSEVDSPATSVNQIPFDLNLPEWSRKKGGLFIDFKDFNNFIKKIHLDAFAQETKKDFEQRMTLKMGPRTVVQSLDTYNEQKTYGSNVQIDLAPGVNHNLILGHSYTKDTLDSDSLTNFTPAMVPGYPSEKFHEASIDTNAVFLQDEWMLGNDFILTLGGRQTWVNSELEDTDDPNSTKGDVSDSHAVFAAGITWSGIQNFTLRGLASQGYRFPDLNKLFTGTAHGGSTTLSNQDLDPETSDNFEIGARFNNGAWDIDLTAFMSLAKDYITTEEIGGNIYKFSNVDEAKTHGLEAHLGYTLESINLTPYVTGTWMQRKYEKPGFSTWDTNTPDFTGRLGVRWEKNITNHESVFWADAWMRCATDADDKSSDGTITTVDSWQTFNLGLGCEFGEKRKFQFSLNLNNILDESYRTAKNSLDEAGFHGVARVGVSF
ncbi:MAG: TonB-dependent receptor [Desulforegulaceae bacterium]|nr:TonB-dependent receptor [Desulforegulaceae bacterium]